MVLSRAEFAKLCGISKPAVTKAEKTGRVVVENGRIDTDHEVNALFMEKLRQRRVIKAALKAQEEGRGAAGGAPEPSGAAPSPISVAGKKVQLDAEYRLEQILTLRLKRLRAVGRLLDRTEVERSLARFNAELEIRLLDLPRRLLPRLAALVKSGQEEEALRALEDEVSSALEHAKGAAVI